MKFIIFDIDGTLTNTKEVDDKAFIKAFQITFGIDISNEIWSDIKHVTDWGITEEIVEREFNRKPERKEYELMITKVSEQLTIEGTMDPKQFEEVNGAKDLLDSLTAKSQFGVGIATGAWEKSAKIKLENSGIDIGDLAFSNSNHYKSREEITIHTIQQLKDRSKAEPKEIIYFGDGLWDFRTCRNLGIQFIGIDLLGDGILENAGAKVVFRDYSNSDEIFAAIENGI